MKRLNIITITKDNVEDAIKTLNSTKILREKFSVLQILVDSSSSRNSSILKKYSTPLVNVMYIPYNELGISKAFNRGLVASNSEWVWFLNSGDVVHRSFNDKYFMETLKLSNEDVVVFKIETGNKISRTPPLNAIWPPIINWLPHPGSVFRTKNLKKSGKFNVCYKIAGDYDMWLKLFESGSTINYVPMVIAKYKLGGISSNQKELSKENVKIIMRHLPKILVTNLINKCNNFAFFIASIKAIIK